MSKYSQFIDMLDTPSTRCPVGPAWRLALLFLVQKDFFNTNHYCVMIGLFSVCHASIVIIDPSYLSSFRADFIFTK